MYARKEFPRTRKAAPHNTSMAETSMKCGFLACVYLLDVAQRARGDGAPFAFSKAE